MIKSSEISKKMFFDQNKTDLHLLCNQCTKPINPNEGKKGPINGNFYYHSECFRCNECNSQLDNTGNTSIKDNKIICKNGCSRDRNSSIASDDSVFNSPVLSRDARKYFMELDRNESVRRNSHSITKPIRTNNHQNGPKEQQIKKYQLKDTQAESVDSGIVTTRSIPLESITSQNTFDNDIFDEQLDNDVNAQNTVDKSNNENDSLKNNSDQLNTVDPYMIQPQGNKFDDNCSKSEDFSEIKTENTVDNVSSTDINNDENKLTNNSTSQVNESFSEITISITCYDDNSENALTNRNFHSTKDVSGNYFENKTNLVVTTINSSSTSAINGSTNDKTFLSTTSSTFKTTSKSMCSINGETPNKISPNNSTITSSNSVSAIGTLLKGLGVKTDIDGAIGDNHYLGACKLTIKYEKKFNEKTSNEKTCLLVHVDKVQNLSNFDKKYTYIKITYFEGAQSKEGTETKKTNDKYDENSPTYGERFRFEIKNTKLKGSKLNFKDMRFSGILKLKKVIGEVNISLDDLDTHPIIDKWFYIQRCV